MITEVYTFLQHMKVAGDIGITIVCENQKEIDLLEKLPVTSRINKELLFNIDLEKTAKNFHQFLFKYLDSGLITYLSDITDKTIYVASYDFNISEDKRSVVNTELTTNLSFKRNIFKIMDLYDLSKLKEGDNQL